MYYAEVSNQEVAIATSGGTAEFSVGGLRMNRIPRDGGNTFSGTGYVGESFGAWQGDNFTQRLRDMGVQAIDRVHRVFDYSATVGGPIVRDRLWFHMSVREWGNQLPTSNSFYDDGSQYIRNGDILAFVPRLTWQISPRNKFTAHLERQGKRVGPKLTATYPAVILPGQRGTDPETATTWNYPSRPYGSWQTKWTSTVSNRILLETGFSRTFILDGYPPPEGAWNLPIGSPEWYSRVAKTDLDTGNSWNSAPWFMRWAYQSFLNSSISYVTGSHNVKAGVQYSSGKTEYVREATGDIQQIRYRSGVPDAAVVGNYPLHEIPRLNYDVAVFAQDSWTVNRLTVNGGLRAEWLNANVPEQTAAAGRFVPERHFAAVSDVPNFGLALSPRVGLSYDLFGNAKTALKFSFGRYLRRHTTDWAARLNPMQGVFEALPWNDRDISGRLLATNGDDIVQDNELDLTRLPSDLAARPARSGHQAGVQHRNELQRPARAAAERFGHCGVVSTHVPQPVHRRQPGTGFQRLCAGRRREPVQRRSVYGLQPEKRGGTVARRHAHHQQRSQQGDLYGARGGDRGAPAARRHRADEHDDPADQDGRMRSAGRSEPAALLQPVRPADAVSSRRLQERLQAVGRLSVGLGPAGQRELLEHAWKRRPDGPDRRALPRELEHHADDTLHRRTVRRTAMHGGGARGP
jgi:hypothetical protein